MDLPYPKFSATSFPTKSCALDPIPTWLLKQFLDQVAPVLTVIVNRSLSCADFTPEMKRDLVTPLIKKLIIDCEIFKNCRPTSNLSFVSKLTERIVCVQLVDPLKENDLYEIFLSAYRQLHSTEAALLRVQNDILQAVDSEGGAILVLLDLSAAFDATDHQKRLDLLDYSFGIRWDALGVSYHIVRIEYKLFKLGLAHQSLWHWNMGFYKDQYLGLFYLPCTPLHLIISPATIIGISTSMLMIRNFVYHISHVIKYLDRPPYHRLRPASRTSKHGWPTTC